MSCPMLARWVDQNIYHWQAGSKSSAVQLCLTGISTLHCQWQC